MRVVNLAVVGLIGITGACVPQSQHEALRRQLVETQLNMANRDVALQKLRAQVRDTLAMVEDLKREVGLEKTTNIELRGQIDALTTTSERLSAVRARLESDLASLLKDRSRLNASVSEMRQALGDMNKRQLEVDRRLAEYKQLVERFGALMDSGDVRIRIVDGKMVVVLTNDVLFPSGSAALSPRGKKTIVEVAQILAGLPSRRLQVEGHTDNVPIHNSHYASNWELASARAFRVLRTMLDVGIRPDRISAATFGENAPVASNTTPEGRQSNRRISIVLVPDLNTLPGSEELRRLAGP